MTLREHEFTDVPTLTGPMRIHTLRPVAEGSFPGLVLWSEIFQVTDPIRRTAALLAGHGFVVAVEEVRAGFCCYPTDIRNGSLGKGMADDTLSRLMEIEGENTLSLTVPVRTWADGVLCDYVRLEAAR